MNERTTGVSSGARTEVAGGAGASLCCMHHAALEALTVPVLVHDDERLLYANAQARRMLGAKESENLENSPVGLFVHPDSAQSAADRGRLLLEQETPLHGVHMKARAVDGRVLYSVVDTEPIRFGASSKALVQLARYVDGDSFVTYAAPPSLRRGPGDPYPCLHRAAFDALPVPVIIQDSAQIIDGNHHSRAVLSGGRTLAGTPLSDVMHPDFIQAARERRSILLDQRHEYRGLSAKLTTLDGATVYIVVDGAPVEYDSQTLGVLVARDVRMV